MVSKTTGSKVNITSQSNALPTAKQRCSGDRLQSIAISLGICSPTGINLGKNCGMRVFNRLFQIVGLFHDLLLLRKTLVFFDFLSFLVSLMKWSGHKSVLEYICTENTINLVAVNHPGVL